MNLFLLRNLPVDVRKEDLESEFSDLGSVEYIRIQPSSPSGRMAIIKVTRAARTTSEMREPLGKQYKSRRLRLVKPGPQETKRGGIEQKKMRFNSLEKALEYLLRSLKILKPLPERVTVKK